MVRFLAKELWRRKLPARYLVPTVPIVGMGSLGYLRSQFQPISLLTGWLFVYRTCQNRGSSRHLEI